MALIVCLIITAALLIKRLTDKIDYENYDKHINQTIKDINNKHNDFENKYEDRIYEDECMEHIKKSTLACEDMKNRLKDEAHIAPTKRMVLMALMAAKGKIPSQYINQGGICNLIQYGWEGREYAQSRKLANDQLIFLKWCNKELKRNGVGEDLRFIPPNQFNSIGGIPDDYAGISVDNLDVAGGGGAYYWDSLKSRVRNASGADLIDGF